MPAHSRVIYSCIMFNEMNIRRRLILLIFVKDIKTRIPNTYPNRQVVRLVFKCYMNIQSVKCKIYVLRYIYDNNSVSVGILNVYDEYKKE